MSSSSSPGGGFRRRKTATTWFEKLTGFPEESGDQVRANLEYDEETATLTSKVNGQSWICGRLETPTLAELRRRTAPLLQQQQSNHQNKLEIRQVVGDVKRLHLQQAGAVFQVASQFNLLEMISPLYAPQDGIGIYERDPTQGPACAISCGAGTIYRNYFVPVPQDLSLSYGNNTAEKDKDEESDDDDDDEEEDHQQQQGPSTSQRIELEPQIGQTEDLQVDCLRDIGKALGNDDEPNKVSSLWTMQNGYALPTTRYSLKEIAKRLESMTHAERDAVRSKLRIGIQWNTQVTTAIPATPLPTATHRPGKRPREDEAEAPLLVTQVYGSALPVAYSRQAAHRWAPFAQLILEASYEATFHVALLQQQQQSQQQQGQKLYLTLLGGGAFGNRHEWIQHAVLRALRLFRHAPIKVRMVSHGTANPRIDDLIDDFLDHQEEEAHDDEAPQQQHKEDDDEHKNEL